MRKPKGKPQRLVWVVMHYEYMGFSDLPRIDALQFHVSSTLAKAEKYIRSLHVDAHSWWQVHPHTVDAADHDGGDEVHYYSHRGKRLKAAPHSRAKAAFQKLAARYPEMYPKSRRPNRA
jgi:hypothetical protein